MVKYVLQIVGWTTLPIIFYLMQLQSSKANGNFQALLNCLQLYAITEPFLSSYLMSVACNVAEVMLGYE
jgi:hypothetical protein